MLFGQKIKLPVGVHNGRRRKWHSVPKRTTYTKFQVVHGPVIHVGGMLKFPEGLVEYTPKPDRPATPFGKKVSKRGTQGPNVGHKNHREYVKAFDLWRKNYVPAFQKAKKPRRTSRRERAAEVERSAAK